MTSQFDAREAFHAAAAAYRLLDRTFKTHVNRSMMVRLISQECEQSEQRILPEDAELGDRIRDFYQSRGLVRMLETVTNDFERQMLQAAAKPMLDWRDLGLVAFMPKGYERDFRQETAAGKMRWADAASDWTPGDKIQFRGEVVKSVFSTKWRQYYVTALTEENKLVLFPSRDNLAVGDRVEGTGMIKGVVDENVTRLRFPKVKKLDNTVVDTVVVE